MAVQEVVVTVEPSRSSCAHGSRRSGAMSPMLLGQMGKAVAHTGPLPSATLRDSGDGGGFQTPPPSRPQSWSPPPVRVSPLQRALRRSSIAQVEAVLQEDPNAAMRPFFDQYFDLPLLQAVRYGCGADVIRLLLSFGAEVNDAEASGRGSLSALCHTAKVWNTPLSAHCQLPPPAELLAWPGFVCDCLADIEAVVTKEAKKNEDTLLGTAMVLIAAGAVPRVFEGKPALWEDALALGRPRLALLLQYYQEAQAYFVLSRAARAGGGRAGASACPLDMLDENVLRKLGCYLVPHGAEQIIFRLSHSSGEGQ